MKTFLMLRRLAVIRAAGQAVGSGIGESDMCLACMECLGEREDAARDDAASRDADARIEAARINKHLWSLGGGSAARLLLLAAWPVVEVIAR